MGKNTNLRKANVAKKDEFYTQLSDIENELKHYKEYFKGKTVLCNCDDPRVSNFFHYFAYNFEHLGLKRLITTCYKNQNPDLFSMNKSEKAVYLIYDGDKNGNHTPDVEEIGIHELKGDGDFRSDECIELLKQADIVVTNPPFSLFREYVSQLIEYDKKFIIWGNNNAITYRDIFSLMKDNKLWLGYSVNKTCIFRLSEDYEKFDKKITELKNDGYKYGKVPAISIYTNIDIKKRHENLIMYKKYDEDFYPHYDNFDAIDVNKVTDIPFDYDGIMGVPITFMDKFNPDQFELIGMAHGDMGQALGVSANLTEQQCSEYFHKNKAFRRGFVCYTDKDKELIVPYMRLLIRRKK